MGKISGFFNKMFGKKDKQKQDPFSGGASFQSNPLYQPEGETFENPLYAGRMDDGFESGSMEETADTEVEESGQGATVSDEASTVNEIADRVPEGGFHAESLRELETDLRSSQTHAHLSAGFFTGSNSADYEAVLTALHGTIASMTGGFSSDSKSNGDMLRKAAINASALADMCQKYVAKKSGARTDKGKSRIEKILTIQKLAEMDKKNLWILADSISSMPADQQAQLTWDKVLNDARTNVVEVDDLYNDDLHTKFGGSVKTNELAGRGLDTGIFTGEVIGRVKGTGTASEAESLDNWDYNTNGKGQIGGGAGKGQDRKISERNVAMSRVASALGLGDIIAKSSTVIVHNQKDDSYKKGNLMEWAKGKEATEVMIAGSGDIAEQAGNDIAKREKIAAGMLSFDFMKNMQNLQVLDYLCGQEDRHAGNFFIDRDKETGQLTGVNGIDNDMAFGLGTDVEAESKTGARSGSKMTILVNSAGELVLPVDAQLAQKIMDMKPDELKYMLMDIIEEDTMQAALTRLSILKGAISKAMSENSPLIVNEWNEAVHEQLISHTTYHNLGVDKRGDAAFTTGKMDLKYSDGEDYTKKVYGDSYYGRFFSELTGGDGPTNTFMQYRKADFLMKRRDEHKKKK